MFNILERIKSFFNSEPQEQTPEQIIESFLTRMLKQINITEYKYELKSTDQKSTKWYYIYNFTFEDKLIEITYYPIRSYNYMSISSSGVVLHSKAEYILDKIVNSLHTKQSAINELNRNEQIKEEIKKTAKLMSK